MADEPLKMDQLVELLDRYTDVYPLSPTAARGWVRAKRILPKADPEVYLEWDKSHWRYHGERDGWTFEHHFRPVADEVLGADVPEAPDVPDMESILTEAHRTVAAERCPDCGDLHEQSSAYIETLLDANEALVGSDAYFIMTVQPRKVGDLVLFEPQIFTQALTDSAKKMLEAQLISAASQLFERDVVDRVSALEAQKREFGR